MATGTGIGLWQAAARSIGVVAGNPGAAQPLTLEVTQGVHAGAKVELTELFCSVGSSTQSDIVLRDPGIAPIHARMRRKGGSVEIDAVGGDVVLSNGETVPKDHGRRCRLPLEAAFGDARIRLTQAGPVRQGSFANRTLLAGGLVLLVVVLSFAADPLSLASTGEHLTAGQNLTQLALADGSQAVMTDATQVGSTPLSLAEAGEQLKSHLQQVGLAGLAVDDANGRLVVSGAIPQQKGDVWTATQAWFDEAYGGKFQLASSVVTGAAVAPPRLELQAIWYGERPYVIAADGARYHEGAFTSDGWVIKHIGEQELLLTKGGASVALRYR